MQAFSPIYSDVHLLLAKFYSTCHSATKRQLTLLKQEIKYWEFLTNIESLHLLAVLRYDSWARWMKEFNVVITVVLGYLLSISFVRMIFFQFSVQIIVEQKIFKKVNHVDSVIFPWVALSIKVSNVSITVVTDFVLGAPNLCHFACHLALPSVYVLYYSLFTLPHPLYFLLSFYTSYSTFFTFYMPINWTLHSKYGKEYIVFCLCESSKTGAQCCVNANT